MAHVAGLTTHIEIHHLMCLCIRFTLSAASIAWPPDGDMLRVTTSGGTGAVYQQHNKVQRGHTAGIGL